MNTAIKSLLFIFVISYCANLTAQKATYSKQAINTLSSEFMAGRGYVDNGHIKAASYIASEFKKIGVSTFNKSYFQNFAITVNTFPDNATTQINDKALNTGNDYILSPASSSEKGTFDVVTAKKIKAKPNKKWKDKFVYISPNILPKNTDELAVVNKAIRENAFKAKGIIKGTNNKLTFSYAQHQNNFVTVIATDSVLPKPLKTITTNIDAKLIANQRTQNIIGYIPGTEQPDSFIVFSGHYDHLGKLGKDTYFPGANDNASGIAMLLSLAKYYSANPSRYSVVFMAFGAEEVGILGSKYFIENPTFNINNIRFLMNMDIMGTGGEGVTLVNGSIYEKEFSLLENLNNSNELLPQIKKRGKAMNSDHYWFTEKGIPAFFMYTMGGISAYHDVFDKPETLPLTKFQEIFKLLTLFVDELDK